MKLKMSIIVAVALLSLGQLGFGSTVVFETTAAITFADSNGNPAVVQVSRLNPVQVICDLTCTYVSYSFCVNEIPGCLEGTMEIAGAGFKGNVGTGYLAANVLTLNTTIISGWSYGNSYYCYAWDSDGNCTDQVDIAVCTAGEVGSCPTEVGTIDITFTKASQGTLTDEIDATTSGTVMTTTQSINDEFYSNATGTVIGVSANNYSCCVGVQETVTTTKTVAASTAAAIQTTPTATAAATRPPSELLAQTGKVPDKVLRRLRALERAQKAYIAERKGDHLGDER